jgi:hypothetical protein
MKTLNQNSNRIFCALIDKMQGKEHLKIMNEPYMPLSVEHIGDAYGGEAQLYSLAHYYTQNGDLMADPEMCFIVADHREAEINAMEQVKIAPYLFKQDNLGIYEESISLVENEPTIIKREVQADHAAFADEWLTIIELQGFLA